METLLIAVIPPLALTLVSLTSMASLAKAQGKDYHGKAPVIYMDQHCRQHWTNYQMLDRKYIYIKSSAVVLLTAKPLQGHVISCVATFFAPTRNHRLLLHFQSLDIDERLYPSRKPDRLRIYDGPNPDPDKDYTRGGLHGRYTQPTQGGVLSQMHGVNLHDYPSFGDSLTLDYLGMPSASFPGFNITLTVFQDLDKKAEGKCGPGLWLCRNMRICISKTLVCDGIYNCGVFDTSDESCKNTFLTTASGSPEPKGHSGVITKPDIPLIIGTAITSFTFLVTVCFVVIFFCRKWKIPPPMPPDPNRIWMGGRWPRNMQTRDTRHLEPPPLYSVTEQEYIPTLDGRLEPPPAYTEQDTSHTHVPYTHNCMQMRPTGESDIEDDAICLPESAENTANEQICSALVAENIDTDTLEAADSHSSLDCHNDLRDQEDHGKRQSWSGLGKLSDHQKV